MAQMYEWGGAGPDWIGGAPMDWPRPNRGAVTIAWRAWPKTHGDKARQGHPSSAQTVRVR